MRVRSEAGSNIIEMAVVLPLLLIISFGIVEFSLALYDKAMITNASREGARFAIVYRANASGQPLIATQAQVQSVVNTYLASRLITFGTAGTPVTQVTPPASYAPGNTYTVTVSYTYHFLVMPAFLIGDSGGIPMTAVTVMRIE